MADEQDRNDWGGTGKSRQELNELYAEWEADYPARRQDDVSQRQHPPSPVDSAGRAEGAPARPPTPGEIARNKGPARQPDTGLGDNRHQDRGNGR
jgi:hypothetical protein